MEFLLDFLPIIIYFLLIIFLIIGIILGIKFIITLNKVEKVVEDVNEKVQTLNGFFHVIDYTTDKIAFATDKMVEGVTSLFHKLLFKKRKKKGE
ncbi:MAG: hypothetical protein HFJ02_01150 [Bacilli bacterium]|nr:hypothetical protein [Bacilli bacterium]